MTHSDENKFPLCALLRALCGESPASSPHWYENTPGKPVVGATLVVARPRFRPIFILGSVCMSDSPENTPPPGKPLVGAIRESPVCAPRALSYQVVRVTTDISDSSENTRPTTHRHSRFRGNPLLRLCHPLTSGTIVITSTASTKPSGASMHRFQGKVAIVTGAGQDAGRAASMLFALKAHPSW